jgi:hypothetical protein
MSRRKAFGHALNAGVAAAAASAIMVPALSGQVHDKVGENDWWGTPTPEVHNARLAAPKNVPDWTPKLSRQFDGFIDVDKFHTTYGKDQIPSHLVVVNQRNKARSMPVDRAWSRSTNPEKPQVWVVGAKP